MIYLISKEVLFRNFMSHSVPKVMEDGTPGFVEVHLDESDMVYVKLRHLYLGEAGPAIESLIEANPAAMMLLRPSSQRMSIENLRQSVFAMEEAQKLHDHTSIFSEIMARYIARHLNLVADFEQSLATGETSDLKPVTEAYLHILNDQITLDSHIKFFLLI